MGVVIFPGFLDCFFFSNFNFSIFNFQRNRLKTFEPNKKRIPATRAKKIRKKKIKISIRGRGEGGEERGEKRRREKGGEKEACWNREQKEEGEGRRSVGTGSKGGRGEGKEGE